MTIAPNNRIRIAADWREVHELNVGKLFGFEIEAAFGRMSLALCAGAIGAQHREAVTALVPVAPVDLQDLIVVGQFERFGIRSLIGIHRVIEQSFIRCLNANAAI